MRLLLDVNVVLDVLLARHPHAAAATLLWARIERGEMEGYLAAHSVTTIHYLARKARGAAVARRMVQDLLTVFRVAAVDQAVLGRALATETPDFEDAVTAAAAAGSSCQAIVTRDPKGFRRSPVPILDPAAASLA